MNNIPFHEIAGIFPLIHGREFVDMKADIAANGVHESIVMYEGQILDGRNRFRACQETGAQPDYVEYKGSDPIGFVLSLNLHRRHLKSDQRAAAAVEALPLYEKEAKARQVRKPADSVVEKIPPQDSGKSRDKVAEKFDTNPRYVSDMKKIKADDPETFEQIKQGERKLSDVKKERKKEERIETISTISAGNEDLGTGKTYPVIYADPPWQYQHSKTDNRKIENHYPTMELDDICDLDVPSCDDSILFLWVTSPKLEEGMRVMREWGFDYRTCAVWDKEKMGMGYYFRQQHELLLVGTKGNIPVPEPANRPRSVFSFEREEHSAKPHQVAEMIEAMYPEFSKLEMFCRSPRDGWDVWGNQSGA